ncbi:MAG: MBL fold metallo-hydrolase RNA specificity domain-containing protein, partial [Steroidobacteraceae bacterium]
GGFAGPVYMTAATRDLVAVLLRDSAHIQQVEAERARQRGSDYVAAYSLADVERLLPLAHVVDYDAIIEAAPGVRLRLRDAGHILGSAIVELWLDDGHVRRKVVCSGDLGQPGRPILRDPTPIAEADVLLMESTYGNREHRPLDATLDELVANLERALGERQGIVLVPAFAVGRTQEFLYHLNSLGRAGRLRKLRVFVDSPMATEVTRITARHFELFDAEAQRLAYEPAPKDHAPTLKFIESVEESMALNSLEGGAIIVAASGMCDGGRIRHHLKHHLSDPRTTVLFIGFQAAGTLGRRIVDGAQTVRIAGEDIEVRASIVTLGGFSAHADRGALLDWLAAFKRLPSRIFLVHGEAQAATALAAAIEGRYGRLPEIPAHRSTVTL